ncbi:amino acid/amide ABC transporter ATP-binding protein 2, HAAT family [Albimonas donghaensis]|uniref:Amino acid/amide ABC transporter ATP-binding protein 2, HAAT family n=1 Tax=Albimonas donghaensis TaxID=356660 RepID=A0A1H2VKW6_9RHOB|nr:ABC transporter ATP-binding protein [Albimonas donghaensis]SDW68519.1 amino acid/amide ABC transporter ATP-binding protein 2, HAAT family [Albimonas donghaensis]
MLEVSGLDAGYGKVQVLRGVSLSVGAGEILCVMGRNGAGKTTAMKAIMGLVPPTGGSVKIAGEELVGLPPHEIPRRGLGYVPQGRRLFAELTVAENLDIGLMTRNRGAAVRERMLDMFPRLRDRLRQRAGTLSGGEQQMLAMARALCLEPSVLLMDEPTEGLQPSMIALIREAATAMKAAGVAIVLVEQRADAVLSVADRVTFLDNGRVKETVEAQALRDDPALLHAHVGV